MAPERSLGHSRVLALLGQDLEEWISPTVQRRRVAPFGPIASRVGDGRPWISEDRRRRIAGRAEYRQRPNRRVGQIALVVGAEVGEVEDRR